MLSWESKVLLVSAIQSLLTDLSFATCVNYTCPVTPTCPPDFFYEPCYDSCYFISTYQLKYHLANEFCNLRGAHLFAPNSQAELQFITNNLDTERNYFFGLADWARRSGGSSTAWWNHSVGYVPDNDGILKFLDDSDTTIDISGLYSTGSKKQDYYLPLHPNWLPFRNVPQGDDFVYFLKNRDDVWQAREKNSFNKTDYFICEASSACFECPAGWNSFLRKCYIYIPLSRMYQKAEADCSTLGATLITPRTEGTLAYARVMAYALSAAFWIGLKKTESDWQWQDNGDYVSLNDALDIAPGMPASSHTAFRVSPEYDLYDLSDLTDGIGWTSEREDVDDGTHYMCQLSATAPGSTTTELLTTSASTSPTILSTTTTEGPWTSTTSSTTTASPSTSTTSTTSTESPSAPTASTTTTESPSTSPTSITATESQSTSTVSTVTTGITASTTLPSAAGPQISTGSVEPPTSPATTPSTTSSTALPTTSSTPGAPVSSSSTILPTSSTDVTYSVTTADGITLTSSTGILTTADSPGTPPVSQAPDTTETPPSSTQRPTAPLKTNHLPQELLNNDTYIPDLVPGNIRPLVSADDLKSCPYILPEVHSVQHGTPTQLHFNLKISRIISYDDMEGTVTVESDISLRWKCTTCPDTSTAPFVEEVERVLVSEASEFWTPDMTMANNTDDPILVKFGSMRKKIQIQYYPTHPNRTLYFYWDRTGIMTSRCHQQIADFPFDSMVCDFHFQLREPEVFIVFGVTDIKAAVRLNEWDLVDTVVTQGKAQALVSSSSPSRFVMVQLKFDRIPVRIVRAVIAPSMILIAISLTSFYIRPRTPKRSIVTTSVPVAFMLAQSVVLKQVPRTAERIHLVTFLFSSCVFSGLIVIYNLALCCCTGQRNMRKVLRRKVALAFGNCCVVKAIRALDFVFFLVSLNFYLAVCFYYGIHLDIFFD